jgi:thiazole synthase ThiGH ThiG subunit
MAQCKKSTQTIKLGFASNFFLGLPSGRGKGLRVRYFLAVLTYFQNNSTVIVLAGIGALTTATALIEPAYKFVNRLVDAYYRIRRKIKSEQTRLRG